MDFAWYTNVSGIVAATIVLVEIIKRYLGGVPYLKAVPTWLYSVVISCLLVTITHVWWKTLVGDDLDLYMRAIMMAATASGVKEILWNFTKPLSASSAARDAEERRADANKLPWAGK